MLAGGATWWKLLLQNRIYVAARLGTNNTLFTTHTTNPQWAAVLRMAAATMGRSTPSENAHANWDLLVRAFLEAREALRDLLKHGDALPVAVRGPAKWMLETVESQLRGLLHGHSVHNYGGEPWSTAITDQTIVARKPTKEGDAYWCAKCNRPARHLHRPRQPPLHPQMHRQLLQRHPRAAMPIWLPFCANSHDVRRLRRSRAIPPQCWR